MRELKGQRRLAWQRVVGSENGFRQDVCVCVFPPFQILIGQSKNNPAADRHHQRCRIPKRKRRKK